MVMYTKQKTKYIGSLKVKDNPQEQFHNASLKAIIKLQFSSTYRFTHFE